MKPVTCVEILEPPDYVVMYGNAFAKAITQSVSSGDV